MYFLISTCIDTPLNWITFYKSIMLETLININIKQKRKKMLMMMKKKKMENILIIFPFNVSYVLYLNYLNTYLVV